MNQIIFDKKEILRKTLIFKIQFIISVSLLIIIAVVVLLNYNEKEDFEKLAKNIYKNLELYEVYKTEKILTDKIYFGKIKIDKINLQYSVFNSYNEELLKISPCKFFGTNLYEKRKYLYCCS